MPKNVNKSDEPFFAGGGNIEANAKQKTVLKNFFSP
jgi:site-specific DNA-adenine methylase